MKWPNNSSTPWALTLHSVRLFLPNPPIIDHKIDYRLLHKLLGDINRTNFANKVKKEGECSELFYRITTELAVPLRLIVRYMLFDQWKDQTLYTIIRECGETKVEIVETGHYKYRVVQSNVSVGKMFGVMEEVVIFFVVNYCEQIRNRGSQWRIIL